MYNIRRDNKNNKYVKRIGHTVLSASTSHRWLHCPPSANLTWFSEEMDDCTNGYAAYILEQVEAAKETCTDPMVLIEQRVDFSRWVEQGFETVRWHLRH